MQAGYATLKIMLGKGKKKKGAQFKVNQSTC